MKILILDDHALFREGLALLLKRLQAEVVPIMAGSCEEALDILKTNTDIDLILVDLYLPGMSGLDGMSVLRQLYPNIPFVGLSSDSDRNAALMALDRGAMGFIPKNSTADTLIAALHLIMAKGIYLPSSIFLENQYLGVNQSSEKSMKTIASPENMGLTPRQLDVFGLIVRGMSVKDIARELDISVNTVKAHTTVVLRTLNVSTRTQAVVAASKLGLKFK